MNHKKSQALFQQALQVIPGGVNSPVRACKNVDSSPLFIEKAQGAFITSVEGDSYIDYVGSWGPMILGHANPKVIQAVQQAANHGLSYGAPTEAETQLVQKIQKAFPSMTQIRLVSSGTEATMSAIRLARGYTQRDKIIKFKGCYHGHTDCLLVEAGSGLLTHDIPSSPGVPKATAQDTLIAEFNHLESVETLFRDHDIAAIIIEPIAGNMNFIPATPHFLQGIRSLCDQHKSLLIFDEVMTGFRVAHGGAQSIYNIAPDITTLGKIVGGGMPMGAFGGRQEIMEHLAPIGPIYQAGTLSGNPIATAAGLATLDQLEVTGFYEKLEEKTKYLTDNINQIAQHYQLHCHANALGGMFGIYWTEKQSIQSLQDVSTYNDALFKRFYHHMLEHRCYFAPSAFEAGFVSMAHTKEDLDHTLAAFKHFAECLVTEASA